MAKDLYALDLSGRNLVLLRILRNSVNSSWNMSSTDKPCMVRTEADPLRAYAAQYFLRVPAIVPSNFQKPCSGSSNSVVSPDSPSLPAVRP